MKGSTRLIELIEYQMHWVKRNIKFPAAAFYARESWNFMICALKTCSKIQQSVQVSVLYGEF